MEVAEELLWIANRKIETIMRPPYARGMQITLQSRYGDPAVKFDRAGFAPGSRSRSEFYLLANAVFGGRKVKGLCEQIDAPLVETLRQIVVCYIYRMDIFPRRKVKIPKGQTVIHLAINSRRLLIAMREVGIKCISNLKPDDLNSALELTSSSTKGRLVYIEAFQHMVEMSKHGLLLPSLPHFEWEVEISKQENDTTAATGKQALSEDNIQVLLSASIENVNRARILLDGFHAVMSDRSQAGRVRAMLSKEVAVLTDVPTQFLAHAIVVLLTMSCANLIFFHLGLRPSELLSLVRGFLSITAPKADGDPERVILSFHRSKGVNKRKLRRFEVHPKLLPVAAILEELNEATGATSDILFTVFGVEEEMSLNTLTQRMRRFCELSGISVKLSSYNWRKSTIDLVARLITNGVTVAAVIVDHISKTETAGYALSSPQFKDDIRVAVMAVWEERAGTLFESVGKPGGLGGLAGKRIENLLSPHITSEDLGLSQEDFVRDMLAQNIFPIQVAPGVLCVKPPFARGACSTTSRDLMADTANCTAGCYHQVQLPDRKQIVRNNISNLATFLSDKSSSRMQKSHAVNRLLDQLVAWPELRCELDIALSTAPHLKKWFPDD